MDEDKKGMYEVPKQNPSQNSVLAKAFSLVFIVCIAALIVAITYKACQWILSL